MKYKHILLVLLQAEILSLTLSTQHTVQGHQASRIHKFDQIWKHIQKVLKHDGYDGTLQFRHRERFFQTLETGPFDLRRNNVYVYLEFKFENPTEVVGWETTGKNGDVHGSAEKRLGFVKEYMVQYEHYGTWHTIINQKTRKQFIISLSNSTNPERPSRIYFPHGLNATALRFYPQFWTGAPFFSVDLYYSKRKDAKSPPSSRDNEEERQTAKPHEHPTTTPITHQLIAEPHSASIEEIKHQTHHKKEEEEDAVEPSMDVFRMSTQSPVQTEVDHRGGNWQHITDTLKNSSYAGSLQHKEKKKLFSILADDRVHLRGDNGYIYLEFKFEKRVEVIGWETKGRRRRRRPGESVDEKGDLVTDYIVQYDHDGKWHSVVNPKNGKTNIKTLSNPSEPEKASRVSFSHGLNTTAIRFYPQQWVGAPYLFIELFYTSRNKSPLLPVHGQPSDGIEWVPSGPEAMKHSNTASVEAPETKPVGDAKTSAVSPDKHERGMEHLGDDDITHRPRLDAKSPPRSRQTDDHGNHGVNREAEGAVPHNRDMPPKVDNPGSEASPDVHKSLTGGNSDENNRHSHVTYASALKRKDGTNEDSMCKTRPRWRYESENVNDEIKYPKEDVDASRAKYGSQDVPFMFPVHSTLSRGMTVELTDYIEIVFPVPLRISKVKIAGANEEEVGGMVTKFSLLYKKTNGKWKYYSDEDELPRVFDTGERSLQEAYVPETFTLPQPIETKYIRIYPHRWTGRPFLSVDFYYCHVKSPDIHVPTSAQQHR